MKYVLDTNVVNWLVSGLIKRDDLPRDGTYIITHVQIDELNETLNTERRARLLLELMSLGIEVVPTETMVLDISRLDHAKWSYGAVYTELKKALDSMNGNKRNNAQDALIAEVAIVNGYTLLTADMDLASVARSQNGEVRLFVAQQQVPVRRPSPPLRGGSGRG